jgi:lysophospholipase L1-like esterase
MTRHDRLPVLATLWLAGVLASACNQSASGSGGTGGTKGGGGSGVGETSKGDAAVGLGGQSGSGGMRGGAGAGGLVGDGAMAGSPGDTGGLTGGGSTGTRLPTGGSGAGGTAGVGDASDADRVDANQDAVERDGASRDALAERSNTDGALGAGDGPADAGGNGDVESNANKKITVWLAGDSTVMECSDSCPCGWGSQFQALLTSNATVANSAVGGRSIQTWLYDPNVTSTMDTNGECVVNPKTYSSRWQAMLDATNGMKPGDYLLIEFGINDGDKTCNRHVGSALFQTYLTTMAQAATKLGAHPVFLTSTSYIGCSGSTAATNRGFVSETKAAGQANNVPVIDLTALSAALYTSLGLCPNNADYTSTTSAVGKFFCEDHTHFEAAGAAQIAKVVVKALKDQGIGLAAYLR